MSDGLPQQIDVTRFAHTGRRLQGKLSLNQLARLSKLVEENQACQTFLLTLDFSRLDDGRRVIKGQVNGCVSMICQRCLEPVEVNLDCDISLGLVADDAEAELLPAELDPLIAGETTQLSELLEDELLLAMPIVPLHEHCERPGTPLTDSSKDDKLSEHEHPFAVLASLKDKQ